LAADDVQIKFSELAIGGVEPYPLSHVADVRIASTVPGTARIDSNPLGNPLTIWVTLHSGSSARQPKTGKMPVLTDRRLSNQCGNSRPDRPPFEQSMRQLEGSIRKAVIR
jgi:hypothetical protein